LSELGRGASNALYLIPTLLGPASLESSLGNAVLEIARSLQCFVAENAKTARQFLKQIGHPLPLHGLRIEELNAHTPADALDGLIAPLRVGISMGLLSEAGCPAVADPGSALVALAHDSGVRVVPLVGPSSLMLALMASGLEGQRFCFKGYLPVEAAGRDRAIQLLEKESARERSTQLFIETPYRNGRLLEALLQVCKPTTRLCLAADLTLPGEWIATATIEAWRSRARPALDRRPTVFLVLAAASA
jgi:16S rRNA (cytidine1402-2'-O)-methyltransferase